MLYTQSFAHLEKLFHTRYDLSSTIRHRGERGRQREDGLLVFLRENLPGAYGVATGEIIPYLGPNPSPQCDIIIYDHLHMPVLGRTAAVQQVPLEAVYAIIECKSILDTSAIHDATAKFAKVREMPRCPSKTRLRKGTSRGPHFFLFGYKLTTTPEACSEFARSSPIEEDTHVVALDRGCTIWITRAPGDVDCVFLNATNSEKNLYETLVLFFVDLLEALRTIDLGVPNYIGTLFSGE